MSKNPKQKKIYITVAALVILFFLTTTYVSADAGMLNIYVEIDGDRNPIAAFTLSNLEEMRQTTALYSSIDAGAAPSTIAAQGITIADLLDEIGVPVTDVAQMELRSMNGWRWGFPASGYLHAARYFFPQIVSGYELESTAPPEFVPGTEDERFPVPPMLALRSYVGRFNPAAPLENIHANDGIRFIVGQSNIYDTPLLNYGRFVVEFTFILSENTSFALPETMLGDGEYQPAPTRPPPAAPRLFDEGLRSDTLTISVGYFGGPYHTKRIFTIEDLEALPQVRQAYSFIDNMPAPVLNSVVGVRLADILSASGIDVNSVAAFHFYCADVTTTWFQSFSREYLLDTARFFFPYLNERWDFDEGAAGPWADEGGIQVETVIALQDNWRRFATEPDFENLNDTARFRLVFGQTDTVIRTASRSAMWIHTIEVMLGGTPPAEIAFDTDILELEVGSSFTLTPTFGTEARDTDRRVEWTSSNPYVTVSSTGVVRVFGAGEAVITARTVVGGLTATIAINAVEASEPMPYVSLEEAERIFVQELLALNIEEEAYIPHENISAAEEVYIPSENISAEEEAYIPDENISAEEEAYIPHEIILDVEEEVAAIMEIVTGEQASHMEPAAMTIFDNPYVPETPSGGVQNWRVFEMSETAVELPYISLPASPLAWVLMSLFFLLGVVCKIFTALRERFSYAAKGMN